MSARGGCGRLSLVLLTSCCLLAVGLAVPEPAADYNKNDSMCYDSEGKPQRCIPPFENAAYNLLIEATNTCGEEGRATPFCKQTGVGINVKSCDLCHKDSHSAMYLTDHETPENPTWWQSQTMFEGIQYPNQVNLTLNLGKMFDITYVRVIFESPRPESWGIYKRRNENSEWEPYQFYSLTCRDTYGLPESKETMFGDDTRVLCTSEYSDIVPLSKGTVAFSTLEGRPGAYNFESNGELQEWVQATDLRITLDRLNTFGDEMFGVEQVLQSYYYAIADVAVGARCTCNGHAGDCVNATGPNGRSQRACRCEHFTTGPDCGECLPFYNDVPWARATSTDAHECKPCNCNGYSDRCYFDKELYKATGHGGHCVDCRDNRDGANCERCRENFYARPEDGYCVACNCNEIGSRSLQCNTEGKCQCKPGVTGDKCDRCAANHYDFSSFGCSSCECSEAGSLNNAPSCDPVTGMCMCKDNVEGKRCRECRPGFFNLAVDNEFGCTPCFCYGHSSLCNSASGYSRVSVESTFVRGAEKWAASIYDRPAALNYDPISQSVTVSAKDRDSVYFLAPERFLGDQRASYNQNFSFKLRVSDNGAAPSAQDVVFEGGNGQQIIQPIFGQSNPNPSTDMQTYTFHLHEHPDYKWQPRLSSRAFISILANLTAIKIRGTYTHQGKGHLDDVRLDTAHRGAAGEPADWVEVCTCPQGYVGQFCESCAPGYHHDPPNGGPFALCVPCNCNGHADICEAETGQCICQHNTAGSNCEHCARGFYGQPLKGTPDDCQACPCPDNGPCVIRGNDLEPTCTECPVGRTGSRCQYCSDGYYGNPEQGVACRRCECNGNVDLNAVGNCNRETGECLKCVNNTAGFHCEECLAGYYGDALSEQREDGCRLCQCYPAGTKETAEGGVAPCDQLTGHCFCKPHVVGRNCDKCEDGYFNIKSGEGCAACNCHLEGSHNRTCDALTGQCECRPGIVGLRCDSCLPYRYGFGREGCKTCDCDEIGSENLQCDANGQCPCLPNVEGRTCDRCKENKHNRQYGCIDCPPCYDLVQEAVNEHRYRLGELDDTLRKIKSNPTVINEEGFKQKLQAVQQRVRDLVESAKAGYSGDKKTLVEQMDDLRDQLASIHNTIQGVDQTALDAKKTASQAEMSIDEAEKIFDKLREQIQEAQDYLETEGNSALEDARRRAEQVGQQNQQMTQIAQEARTVADSNIKEAEKLRIVAEQAKNTSLEAYNLAKKAIARYTNISDEIRFLENKLMALDDRYADVQKQTQTAVAKSDVVSKEALGMLILGFSLPQINLTEMQQRVETVSKEAATIKEQARLLLEENTELIQAIEEKVRTSEQLVDRAEDQQGITADMLVEVDEAHAMAKNAVNRGSQTLKEAQDTLTKLSGFDAEVQAARAKAQDAMQDIDKILGMIEDARHKSAAINQVLDGSEQNANRARHVAQEAQANANNASAMANDIRIEANKTKAEVIKLGLEADKLHLRVNTTDGMIRQFEDKIRKDAVITEQVKRKVGQTKSNVTSASQQIKKALDDIAEITRELEALPEISNEDLDRLEGSLRKAESEIHAADLDQRIRSLTEAKNLQTQWVKNYEEEVRKLGNEVANIVEMRKVLPSECFKNVNLEP
ncbi:laminin subunit gamma-1 isoform X2 [Trichogramma pretiosum]|uniref:laminin subunit gamma-1 isoform X1 n=1 Tax=Trichogramma pretiosum TaxID=7493 RepID=UPI0006C95884|nr:laminin subunit gamma-1 isoform X1 [Trichogramma pretiosum]XP_023314729.1 laminin subunit gamma-1 isoform X2 [Trichogramma pretiosum]